MGPSIEDKLRIEGLTTISIIRLEFIFIPVLRDKKDSSGGGNSNDKFHIHHVSDWCFDVITYANEYG